MAEQTDDPRLETLQEALNHLAQRLAEEIATHTITQANLNNAVRQLQELMSPGEG